MKKQFYMVNAYTTQKLEGANIVILPDAAGLSDELLQKLAKEFNADQTVFITQSPDNTPKLRIFTALQEEAFGGHPTIAAIHLLDHLDLFQNKTSLDDSNESYQACVEQSIGTLDVTVNKVEGQANLQQYKRTFTTTSDSFAPTPRELSEMLSLPEDVLQCGPEYSPIFIHCDKNYLVVPCKSAEDVRKARFNHQPWITSCAVQNMAKDILLFTNQTENPENNFLCRLVGPDIGVHEDPPVGSSMPAFCSYLHDAQEKKELAFKVERGNSETRFSLLNLTSEKNEDGSLTVWSGGHAVIAGSGELYLD